MKEYRLACSRDEHHNRTGKEYHYETIYPTCAWGLMNKIYDNKEDAKQGLKIAKKRCAQLDEATNNDMRDTIRVRQYNFRILEREIGEWK